MRILGSDYDGTFAEGGIGEDKLLAVEKWRAAGNKFGIISGRGGDFLQVPRGVNKAEGLLRVAEHFGIPREDVIAVGDNGNDMDMIRAFRSYAMENGVCELRAAAGAIVGSVTELIMRELREQTNK